MQPRLILASTSAYRCTLLEKLGIDFNTAAPEVDESPKPGEIASTRAQRLAMEKAQAIAHITETGLVIGSDQVASLGDTLLRKPHTRDNAIAQLRQASGTTVEFHTAVCVADAETGRLKSALDVCRVSFRSLSLQQIERYVDRENPLNCSGSFKSEGLGITLFTRIDGEDPNALVGLPLIKLTSILMEFGLEIP